MAGVEEQCEVVALREALRQQARVAEELQAALEAERQAAASGAGEALATIQRLQAEKGAERREAEQFRRVAEMRIQHGEGTIASLRAVVFHRDMEVISLNCRLLAACAAAAGVPLPPATTIDHRPWLRKLADNGVAPRRNASRSLPAAHLEELSSEPDGAAVAGDRKPFRTVSDIGEVIGREDWARHGQSAPPKLPNLLRRARSHVRQRSLQEGPVLLEEATREGGRRSSCNEQSYQPQGELLLMNHSIELLKYVASPSLLPLLGP